MSKQFTPGPWEISRENKAIIVQKDKCVLHGGICHVLDDPKREANAALIAAAPTMFEALKLIADAETRGIILSAPGQLEAIVKVAKQALAQATGK